MITGLTLRIKSAENGYILDGGALVNPRVFLTDIEVVYFVEKYFKMQDILISQFEPDANERDERVG